ncbi:MAG: hypothetical protein MUC36_09430 [Planctomycetes bacterium]|nr:hypothetical protein [Planctomycetota bacterium]
MNYPLRVLAIALHASFLLPAQAPAVLSTKPPEAPLPAAADPASAPLPTMPEARPMPGLRTPIHTADPDLGSAYGTWAAGDDYKVSFHDGMQFVPYLGADYPTTQTLRWQTRSATVGGVEMVQGEPIHWHTDFRYEYRFAGITEAYDVLSAGLEQTFVLHTLPAAGDLVIRGTVASRLRSRTTAAAHQPLTFCDDAGSALVEYGRAIAIDGSGRRTEVTTEHRDGLVTLTVPGSWLTEATLPLVVDPMLATVATIGVGGLGSSALLHFDIARDGEATARNLMLAYSRAASANDSDLWLRLANDDYSDSTIVFSDITTAWSSDQPSCCFVGGADRFVSVFRRKVDDPAECSSSGIRCKLHPSGSTVLTTNVGVMPQAAPSLDYRPDVGGIEAFASGSAAMVVFQRAILANCRIVGDYVICARIDATTTNGTFGSPVLLAQSASPHPSITPVAAGGPSSSWACVWSQRGTYNPFESRLTGALINQSGAVSTGRFHSVIQPAPLYDLVQSTMVAGNAGRYAVVFKTPRYQVQLPADQLWLQRFDWPDGAAAPTAEYAPVLLRSSPDTNHQPTGIAYDTDTRSHWAIGYRRTTATSSQLHHARVGYDGKPTELPTTAYESTTLGSVVGGNCVFNRTNDTFLFATATTNLLSTQLRAHTMTYTTPAPVTKFGGSCGGATIDWTGSRQIGSEFCSVFVTGAPTTAAHFLLLSLQPVDLPVLDPAVHPGCRLLVSATVSALESPFAPRVGSSVTFPLSLPSYLHGQTFHFQDWYAHGQQLFSTQRLTVPVVR